MQKDKCGSKRGMTSELILICSDEYDSLSSSSSPPPFKISKCVSWKIHLPNVKILVMRLFIWSYLFIYNELLYITYVDTLLPMHLLSYLINYYIWCNYFCMVVCQYWDWSLLVDKYSTNKGTDFVWFFFVHDIILKLLNP